MTAVTAAERADAHGLALPVGLLLGLLLVWVGAAGCTEEASPRNLVEELRVLAIVADPPEVSHPSTSTLQALVAGAEGEVAWVWSACFFPGSAYEGFPCLDEAAEVDLGTEASATALIPDLSPILQAPELRELHIDLSAGVEVLVRLEVSDESGRVVQAVKGLKVSESTSPNQNPIISEITKDGAAWTEDVVLEVGPDDEVLIGLQIDPESLQAYTLPGASEPKVERPLISWFSSAGTLDRERASADDPTVIWSPVAPASDALDTEADITLWFVLRDDRGGAAWTSRKLHFTP